MERESRPGPPRPSAMRSDYGYAVRFTPRPTPPSEPDPAPVAAPPRDEAATLPDPPPPWWQRRWHPRADWYLVALPLLLVVIVSAIAHAT